MKYNSIAIFIFAGILAAGAASAQTSRGTADINAQTGLSDSMQTQRPSGTMPASRASVKASAKQNANSMTNSDIPMGEASTRTKGQINAVPPVASTTTRAEVRKEARLAKPKDGQNFVPAK